MNNFFLNQQTPFCRKSHHKKFSFLCFFLVLLQLFLTGGQAMALKIESPSFSRESKIPALYTCEGSEISPQLEWSDSPQGTKSFALIAEDPDAVSKSWTHWVIFNIPADSTGLPQDFPHDEALPDGIRQGLNDEGNTGYGAPCPPPGKPHRYYFRLYALDDVLDLKGRVTKDQLLRAMKDHILEQSVIMGTYQR